MNFEPDVSIMLVDYRQIPKISSRAYIFQRPFLRGLCTEGVACIGKEIYNFCFVLLCIRGQIPSTSQLGAYIRRGDLTDVFLCHDFRWLMFGGAYSRNFTVSNNRS